MSMFIETIILNSYVFTPYIKVKMFICLGTFSVNNYCYFQSLRLIELGNYLDAIKYEKILYGGKKIQDI